MDVVLNLSQLVLMGGLGGIQQFIRVDGSWGVGWIGRDSRVLPGVTGRRRVLGSGYGTGEGGGGGVLRECVGGLGLNLDYLVCQEL